MSQHPFCIFGRKPVLEAFSAGKRFDKILLLKGSTGDEVRQISHQAKEHNTPIQQVPKEKLDRVAKKYAKHREANHQGVIGFLSLLEYQTLDDAIYGVISNGVHPFFLILDGITDVGNFGAIARSAECLGAHALVIPAQGAAQINAEAMKASAGALNHISVCRENSLITAVKFLKANGFHIFGTRMEHAIPVGEADFQQAAALILGAEGSGISEALAKLCDTFIRIPMTGQTESLNVSVSAGIILHEALKQRKG